MRHHAGGDAMSGDATSPEATGLGSAEAAARLAQYGPNSLEVAGRESWVVSLLKRFSNPLVVILLFAAGVSALTGEAASFAIIAGVIGLSVLIDLVQERRAEDAAAALRQRVALTVQVLRDGQWGERPAAALVPGDVVRLAAGSLVPADGWLLEARDLFVNEALLTGEAYPVEKTAAAAEDDAHAVFMGSSVVSGTARVLIAATGHATRLGEIARSLRREPPPTAFTLGIHRFGLLILRLTVLMVLFVLLGNLLLGRPVLDSFLFALALAVGLTPELLPMVVSVTLARGALRMAQRQVIVKRLSAIHDLGAMDVLCSDKTGTLTEAQVRVVRQLDGTGAPSEEVLDWAKVNAGFETGLRSPLDEAILAAPGAMPAGWRKIDEVPFDFERRRVSVLAEREGRRFLVVKGAPEDVLALCVAHRPAGAAVPRALDPAARAAAEAVFARLGEEGFRALGIAWREVDVTRAHIDTADEAELVFAGYVAFLDPPKESARPALAELAALGVVVKVVTGDNERVTRRVCTELGLPCEGLLTGPELAALDDEALSARLGRTTAFCRVTPAQKARVIRAFRRAGHVVGYLGDGINDAPSLHAADVGLSVEGAVDVAKDAAAMILLRHELGVLAEGVREGRRTFANIMKYVMMGTSSNFGNMLSMAAAVLLLPFLPMLPVQILANNLLYDLSETAIPFDRVDAEAVTRPRHWDMRTVRDFMLVLGPLSSAFDLLTFGLLAGVFGAGAALFQTGWFIESMATQVLVIFLIRTRGNPFASRPHPLLVASSLGVLAVAVALPFTPFGAWLGFVPPPPALLAALAGLTVAYLGAVELAKRWFHARHRSLAG
ncbi:magnesium-translocating P-type ATPase [Belnapia sp. T6]|uniref:Magnesium-transporting ATPase, P-type 1 n=2 Tax=Belnapia mucosa TaxID=2804532 RepID=A0ABS1V3B6_9PROT|nr:magnesium-translocating P-type ATPase [Belnapia mucosa]